MNPFLLLILALCTIYLFYIHVYKKEKDIKARIKAQTKTMRVHVRRKFELWVNIYPGGYFQSCIIASFDGKFFLVRDMPKKIFDLLEEDFAYLMDISGEEAQYKFCALKEPSMQKLII